LTPTFGSCDDEQFDEARIERRFSENPDLAVVEFWKAATTAPPTLARSPTTTSWRC
jgi:hypothetical protein